MDDAIRHHGAFTPRRANAAKATLRDVAEASGVSLATASRALARPDMVSARLVALVEQTCRDLNYIPNHAARALSLERSQAVGVIVPLLTNHIFAAMAEGIQSALDPLGFALLISCSHHDVERELAQAKALIVRGVDAMILATPQHRPETLQLLERAGVPYVCAGSSSTAPERPMVTYDSAAAMVLAVDLVVRAGHSRVAVLSGPSRTTPVIRDRLEGALARLRHHGMPPPPGWVVEAEYTVAGARRAAAGLLTAAERPSAIVCTGDMHAMAVLTEAHFHGIPVPAGLSVTGCNDMTLTHYAIPALTTIRTPYAEIGRLAASQALALIKGDPIAPKVLLQATLVERASVAPPPACSVPASGGTDRARIV